MDPEGLHMRPAQQFAKLANQYSCEVRVRLDQQEVNGKSVTEMMKLLGPLGSSMRLIAEGEDAPAAVEALSRFVEAGFPEEKREGQGGNS